MGSVDKAAIVWTIAIVIFGAGIAVVGSSFDQADSKQDMAMMDSMNDDKMMMQDNKMTDMEKMMDNDREMSDMEKMMDNDREMSDMEKMIENDSEKFAFKRYDEKVVVELSKEETGPVTKSVSIPSGTSVPGCEDADKCFIPSKVSINAGDTISWTNDDTAVHTTTGGSISTGTTGTFDSGLIQSGVEYKYTFASAGTFDYFCVVHPWMSGTVSVN